jgi:Flp pilus assembly protein TadD
MRIDPSGRFVVESLPHMTRQLTAIVLAFLGFALLSGTPLSGSKHETWVEVRSPNFLVVSNAGEKQARKTAIRFEQIRAVFRRSLKVASEHATPPITILAVKDEESMKALLPEYWAKGHSHPAGIFMEDDGQYFAAIQLDAPGSNPYDTIYHEYYHSLTLPYYPNLPLWAAEGLAEFFGNTQISDSEVGMGRPDPDLIEELRQGKLIPLDVLFKVDHTSPYYNEQNKTSIFYAESWALTHYLMVGDKASHRPMLTAYLNEVSRGATQEQATAKGFGDLKQLQAALNKYIQNNSFFYLKSGPPPEISASDLQVRELSDAETYAYRGGFTAVGGRPKEAIPILQQAVKLDPKLALGYQYLGFAEFQSGERSEALADFRRAIELNPKNAMTRFLRAYLASTREGGAVADDSEVETDLRAAIAADPEFAPPYGVLAVYLAVREQNLPEALTFALKAVSLQPGNPGFQIDLAQVLARMNRYGEARAAALRARANSTDPRQREQAEQFEAYLQREQSMNANDSGTAHATTGPAGMTGAAGAASATPEPTSAADRSDAHEATGVVGKVSCMNGVKFELRTDSGSLTLYIKAGAQVRFQMTSRSAGPFNPCTSLQGQRVTARYQPDDAKGKSGNLESLTVLSGGDSNAPASAESGRHLVGGSEHKEPVTSLVEGNVKEVSCKGNELVMTVDATDGLFTLHARDATRVSYEKDVALDNGEFQACSQLQGHRAKVTFVVADNEKFDGEIQAVEILK